MGRRLLVSPSSLRDVKKKGKACTPTRPHAHTPLGLESSTQRQLGLLQEASHNNHEGLEGCGALPSCAVMCWLPATRQKTSAGSWLWPWLLAITVAALLLLRDYFRTFIRHAAALRQLAGCPPGLCAWVPAYTGAGSCFFWSFPFASLAP